MGKFNCLNYRKFNFIDNNEKRSYQMAEKKMKKSENKVMILLFNGDNGG